MGITPSPAEINTHFLSSLSHCFFPTLPGPSCCKGRPAPEETAEPHQEAHPALTERLMPANEPPAFILGRRPCRIQHIHTRCRQSSANPCNHIVAVIVLIMLLFVSAEAPASLVLAQRLVDKCEHYELTAAYHYPLISQTPVLNRLAGELEPLPSDLDEKWVYAIDWLPVRHKAHKDKQPFANHSHLSSHLWSLHWK